MNRRKYCLDFNNLQNLYVQLYFVAITPLLSVILQLHPPCILQYASSPEYMDPDIPDLYKLHDKISSWAQGMLMHASRCSYEADSVQCCSDLKDFFEEGYSKNDAIGTAIEAFQFVMEQDKLIRKLKQSVDSLNEKVIVGQDVIIKLQGEVIATSTEHVTALQSSVKSSVEESLKSGFKTYSAAVGDQARPEFTQQDLKRVVKNVFEEDDRSRNVMIFGLPEKVNEKLEDCVSEVFLQIGEKPRVEAERVGSITRSGTRANEARPVKVTLSNSALVSRILLKAKDLRLSSNFKEIYICPDRSPEERIRQRKVIADLKERIKKDPGRKYFIKGGKVCTVDLPSTTS